MVYVEYPHSTLLQSQDYKDWVAKRDRNEKVDWRDLFDWLGEHTRIEHKNDRILSNRSSKCWYSEMPISGDNSKDVEHFRPKNSATPITAKHHKKLKAQIGFDLPMEEKPFDGYKWLEFEPLNYRLSSPHSNRAGGKWMAFPILKGTDRLHSPLIPDPKAQDEFSFLLDPSNIEDANCFWVFPNGEMFPRFGPDNVQPKSIKDQWNDSAGKFIRAWTSIFVYKLDHPDLIKARQGIYEETLETISFLIESLEKKENSTAAHWGKILFRMISGASPYSLAARCAIFDQFEKLGDTELEKATDKMLSFLLKSLESKEGSLGNWSSPLKP